MEVLGRRCFSALKSVRNVSEIDEKRRSLIYRLGKDILKVSEDIERIEETEINRTHRENR